MNSDTIAIILGIIAVAVIICFFIWRMHLRKKAERQMKEEFIREGDEHEC